MKSISNNFDDAVAHFDAGRMEAAAAICTKILAGRPEHIDALRMQGMIAFHAGHAGLAVQSLKKVVRALGDDAQALSELAFALLQFNRLEEALDMFGRAVAIDPDAAEAHNNLGVAYRRLNRLDDAAAAFRRAIKIRPDFAEALMNLGIALQSQKQLEEALRSYKRALALMPSCARLIELNLASMGKGTLWLDPNGLKRHLESLVDDA